MKLARALFYLSLAVFATLFIVPFLLSPRGKGGDVREPLRVYCAAGIKIPVADLAQRYEAEYGVPVLLQYGGSGTLLANLEVSGVGDLYVAGDRSYTDAARSKGLVAEVLPLARMRPVIAVRAGNPAGIAGIRDLLRPGVRVAAGNPEAASIGRQTRRILEEAGLWEAFERQVRNDGVFKPTVPEIANDVKIGSVDAGIVWDATANLYPELDAVRVPEFDRSVQEVCVAVAAACERPTDALRFARYLNSTVGNDVFRAHGFAAVDGDRWDWEPEITFFCGAVNRRAVDEVVHAFSVREGVRINTVYNGCGILTGQMRTIRQDRAGRGFPDTYMACDRYYLDTVSDWFTDDVNVSEADIVIAVPKGNPGAILGLADLTREGVRVAVGQPEQCTIGALTRILLEKEGVSDAVMANVVVQSASSAMLVPAVTTGSVDAAIAYVTDTRAESDKVDTVRIASPYAKAVQPFSIARTSPYKYLGHRFLDAVTASRKQFEGAGFRFLADPSPGGASEEGHP